MICLDTSAPTVREEIPVLPDGHPSAIPSTSELTSLRTLTSLSLLIMQVGGCGRRDMHHFMSTTVVRLLQRSTFSCVRSCCRWGKTGLLKIRRTQLLPDNPFGRFACFAGAKNRPLWLSGRSPAAFGQGVDFSLQIQSPHGLGHIDSGSSQACKCRRS